MSDPSDDDDDVTLKSTLQEAKIIYRCGGDVHLRVALRHQCGHLVDPLHEHAAEKTAGVI